MTENDEIDKWFLDQLDPTLWDRRRYSYSCPYALIPPPRESEWLNDTKCKLVFTFYTFTLSAFSTVLPSFANLSLVIHSRLSSSK